MFKAPIKVRDVLCSLVQGSLTGLFSFNKGLFECISLEYLPHAYSYYFAFFQDFGCEFHKKYLSGLCFFSSYS